MMTSFAFIFGLFPLVIAKGAGAATRHAVGTPVFGGMIAAAIFGVFLIPLLFIVTERMRQWTASRSGRWPSLHIRPSAIYASLRRLWRRRPAR
jgi:HAE1 family hydrophobic/amphiphilic exporter-1